MIPLLIVLVILFWHWIADFILQTDWEAQNKSKEWKPLLSHTIKYSLVWFFPMFFIFALNLISEIDVIIKTFSFMGITFICHTITDYFTSRLNTKLWNNKEVHYFFVSIGFDQFLHFTQLLLTYYLLT